MKSKTGIFIVMVLLFVIVMTFADARSVAVSSSPHTDGERFTTVAIIEEIDEHDGCLYLITSIDGEFHCFCRRGTSGFETGDVCSVLIAKAGQGITDYRIVDLNPSGWNIRELIEDKIDLS